MQLLEHSLPGVGVRWNIEEPYFLTGFQAPPDLGHLVGEGDFATRQEQQAPLRRPARRAVAARPPFAHAVCRHVRDFAGLARVNLPYLVETQQRIAMHLGDALDPVGGRAPRPQIAVDSATAPNATGGAQDGCLSGTA